MFEEGARRGPMLRVDRYDDKREQRTEQRFLRMGMRGKGRRPSQKPKYKTRFRVFRQSAAQLRRELAFV